jgi:HD superfamily phosphohydrolase YqeK
LFQITDEELLTALNCHTTLRAGASTLDKVLFMADKLSWTGQNALPCKDEILSALEENLDKAVLIYIQWVMEDNSSSKVIHPWFSEAKYDLWEKMNEV